MNVVITGAGKGIGLALVRRFLEPPNHRVWACSRDIRALKEINNNMLVAEALDITQVSEAEFFDKVSSSFDHVDILIHNAGLLINKPFSSTLIEDWQKVFETNLFAVVKLNQALLPLLRKSAAAHIVHISSMGGVQGSSKFPGLSAYSASKAALANLTECMAEELKNDGIHVNCLALGAVDTEMLAAAFPGYKAGASPDQMAAFIANFCLNNRHLFNGKIIPVSASTP